VDHITAEAPRMMPALSGDWIWYFTYSYSCSRIRILSRTRDEHEYDDNSVVCTRAWKFTKKTLDSWRFKSGLSGF